MLAPRLLAFIARHDLANLSEWAARALVPRHIIHQARSRKKISRHHLAKLARVVGEEPAAVRAVLLDEEPVATATKAA